VRRAAKPDSKHRRPNPEGRKLRPKPVRSHLQRRPRNKVKVVGRAGSREKKRGPFPLRVLRAKRRLRLANPRRHRSGATRLELQLKEAASRSMELLDETLQKVNDVREQLIEPRPQDHESSPPAAAEIASGPASSETPAVEAEPTSTGQKLVPDPLDAPYRGPRKPIGSQGLEAAITQAVKSRGAGCQDFVGVIVQRTKPASPSDANWNIKGVRFGVVCREEAGKVLATVVARMQQEFSLSSD
jgi:hypothetical protein